MKASVKILSLSLCLILALLSFTACKKKDSLITDEENLLSSYSPSSSVPKYNFRESADLMPENYDIYIDASLELSLDLLREIAGKRNNTALSPLGVSELVALLSNGSVSHTSQTLKNVSGKTLSLQELNLCNHYLRQRLSDISKEGTFNYSVSLWLNNRFDVKPTFLQTAADYFKSGIIRTDFSGEKFYEKVNGYTAEQNGGKKQGEVNSISPEYMMFAVSDVFSQDSWLSPFDESSLYSHSFRGTDETTDEVFMLSSESYLSSDIAEGFTKSLKDSPVRFCALMPKEDISISEFIELLTPTRLKNLIDSETPAGKVQVALPVFSCETDISLRDTLTSLGAGRAFDPESANFSDLSSSDKVVLNDLLHYSSVGITPEGVSQSTGEYSSENALPSCELTFSRPFVYVIYDNESKIPVLIGTVENNP